MSRRTAAGIREVLLTVVHEMLPRHPNDASSLQQANVLNEVHKRLALGPFGDYDTELAILTAWGDLFRTGYLGWGFNITNPNPPFFHLTGRGRRALERLSRDPGNPAGYIAHLKANATLNPVASSYLDEALECFSAGLHKAAAVMLGAASECMIFELRDACVTQIQGAGQAVGRDLQDWKAKKVVDALKNVFSARVKSMPQDLQEDFDGYWSAFVQQIRVARNDAGHPKSIAPVSEDDVHASFLVFPEVARTVTKLLAWAPMNL